MVQRAGICIGLVLITWFVFGQTRHYDFVNYDDNTYVYGNSTVTHGLTRAGVVQAFTAKHSGNWHPLTTLSHMLDCQVWGLRPGWHHFSNVLLHSISVVLLFLVLLGMTGATWQSALVAAIFAIHPLHVESVAWISERKDVLSGLFFMLTLSAYFYYARRPSAGGYFGVLVALAMGLLSKPMLVTVPLILLLLDYWPLQRFGHDGAKRPGMDSASWWKLIVEKIPLLLMSLAASLVTIMVQKRSITPIAELSIWSRLSNGLISYVVYLGQMLWPVRLAVLYPHPHAWSGWMTAGAAFVLVGITAVAIKLRRNHPYFLIGWCWYLVMLVPVIGLIQVGFQARADRYTYLPQIGIALAAAWGIADALKGFQYRRQILAIAGSIVVLALALQARQQVGYWRGSEALWLRTLAVTSDNEMAHQNFGSFLFDQKRIEEAIHEFETALALRPNYPDAIKSLAVALTEKGRVDQAIEQLLHVLQLSPNDSMAYYDLGNAFVKKGDLTDGIQAYQTALRIQPRYPEAHYNLGLALDESGQTDEAIAQYQAAIDDKSDYAEAHFSLGNALLNSNRLAEAAAQYEQALQIRPVYPEVENNLGLVLFQMNQVTAAIQHWRRTIELRPDFPDALNNLAWLLATDPDASVRDGARAVILANRACQLTGSRNPSLLRTLAAAEAENGHFDEAITTGEKAVELATEQSDAGLGQVLRGDLDLYRKHTPVRIGPQPNNVR